MAAGTKRKIADANLDTLTSTLKTSRRSDTAKSTTKASNRKTAKNPVSGEEGNGTVMPSVKDLASSDPKLRRHAVQKIMSHLNTRPSTSPLSTTEALQLWRGFYVALYMHDSKSAISVQNLIAELAGTFDVIHEKDLTVNDSDDVSDQNDDNDEEDKPAHADAEKEAGADEWNGLDDDDDAILDVETTPLPPTNLTTWSAAFWTTMAREWPTIDSHRMNKYLLLVRLVLRRVFAICVSSCTSPSPDPTRGTTNATTTTTTTPTQMNILSLHPLHPRSPQVPNGLRLHLVDIYVDEVDGALASSRSDDDDNNNSSQNEEHNEQKNERLKRAMLAPLRRIAKHGLVRVVRVRAREELERV